MSWIEEKYVGSLAPRLDMFKRVEGGFNFRCFICGDSRKSKTKARGFLLRKNDRYTFYCHNCSASLSFNRFLQTLDPNSYNDYVREKFLENTKYNTTKIVEPPANIGMFIVPKFIKYTALSDLKKISQLPVDHPAKKYVVGRLIPPKYHSKLFYAPKFKKWTNTLIPNKFDLEKKDEPRLVIPFIDQGGNLFGFQGRAFFDVDPRYITIILDPDKPRVYGLESVDLKERVYVVEGPIDSMFLPNCLAMGGAHLDKTTEQIGLKKNNTTVVYDNEPRNVEIIRAIEKAIDSGYNVCIWPQEMQHKDINDMVKSGMSPWQIQATIDKHTYSDLSARVVLMQWKKI